MNEAWGDFDKLAAAFIGLALVAVLVSGHSNTSNQITTGFKALTTAISTLMSPLQSKAS